MGIGDLREMRVTLLLLACLAVPACAYTPYSPASTTTTTTKAPTAAPAATAAATDVCNTIFGNKAAKLLPICNEGNARKNEATYSGIGTDVSGWIKKCNRKINVAKPTGGLKQCDSPVYQVKFNAQGTAIPPTQPSQCIYNQNLDNQAIYKKGGALWGHGETNSLAWTIGTDRFHSVCHANDKLIRAVNAAGQTTGARAKVIKFVVCKEQCTAGDTSCTKPALCASVKSVTSCRMAKCKLAWQGYAGIQKCPELNGQGLADWTGNLDWTNTSPCTKAVNVAIAMTS